MAKGTRYQVGCAGMFASDLRQGITTYGDENEALAAAHDGPPGYEVYDTLLCEWIGPSSREEGLAAKERLARRRSATYDSLIWNAILNVEHHHQLIRWRLERDEKIAEAIREANALYRQRSTYPRPGRPHEVRPSDEAWNRTLDRYNEAVPLAPA